MKHILLDRMQLLHSRGAVRNLINAQFGRAIQSKSPRHSRVVNIDAPRGCLLSYDLKAAVWFIFVVDGDLLIVPVCRVRQAQLVLYPSRPKTMKRAIACQFLPARQRPRIVANGVSILILPVFASSPATNEKSPRVMSNKAAGKFPSPGNSFSTMCVLFNRLTRVPSMKRMQT